jgi:hypothetical protein
MDSRLRGNDVTFRGGRTVANFGKKWLRVAVENAKRLFKREPRLPEEDPYAYVTAPKKPRPLYRSSAAVADRPED